MVVGYVVSKLMNPMHEDESIPVLDVAANVSRPRVFVYLAALAVVVATPTCVAIVVPLVLVVAPQKLLPRLGAVVPRATPQCHCVPDAIVEVILRVDSAKKCRE